MKWKQNERRFPSKNFVCGRSVSGCKLNEYLLAKCKKREFVSQILLASCKVKAWIQLDKDFYVSSRLVPKEINKSHVLISQIQTRAQLECQGWGPRDLRLLSLSPPQLCLWLLEVPLPHLQLPGTRDLRTELPRAKPDPPRATHIPGSRTPRNGDRVH